MLLVICIHIYIYIYIYIHTHTQTYIKTRARARTHTHTHTHTHIYIYIYIYTSLIWCTFPCDTRLNPATQNLAKCFVCTHNCVPKCDLYIQFFVSNTVNIKTRIHCSNVTPYLTSSWKATSGILRQHQNADAQWRTVPSQVDGFKLGSSVWLPWHLRLGQTLVAISGSHTSVQDE
jgi:hypothetical protein